MSSRRCWKSKSPHTKGLLRNQSQLAPEDQSITVKTAATTPKNESSSSTVQTAAVTLQEERSTEQTAATALEDNNNTEGTAAKAPEVQSTVTGGESDIDPEWHDCAVVPSFLIYSRFDSPPNYQTAMLADKANWGCGGDRRSLLAITKVMAHIVFPRLIDLDQWRALADNFFRRLCAHRRRTHDRTWDELLKLRSEVKALCAHRRRTHDETWDELLKLRAEVRALEEKVKLVERASQGKGQTPRQQERGRSTTSRQPESSIEARTVLNAQLQAVAARSNSPAYHTMQAVEAYNLLTAQST